MGTEDDTAMRSEHNSRHIQHDLSRRIGMYIHTRGKSLLGQGVIDNKEVWWGYGKKRGGGKVTKLLHIRPSTRGL